MKYNIYYIIIIIIAMSCSNHEIEMSKYINIQYISIEEKNIYNHFYLKKVDSIEFGQKIYNIDSFIISNKENKSLIYTDAQQGIVKSFDFDTKESISIGKSGRGPFEYMTPTYLRKYESFIYIWDASQLKFIVFDRSGKPVRESKTFDRAIRKFDVINSDSLVIKMSGGFTGESVGIYSFNADELLENSLTGVQDNRDILLDILRGTGGVIADYPYYYYALPGNLHLHIVDLQNNEERILKINSPYFEVDEFEGDIREFVNTNREGLIEFITNNSAILGLFKYKRYIILQTINGTTDISSTSQNNIHHNRYYVFYIFDDKNNYMGNFKLDYKDNVYGYYIIGEGLYELVYSEENGSGQYVLNVYHVKTNIN